MAFGPILNQLNYTPDGAEDCFETCLAMVLQHLGHNVSPQQILAVHYGPTDLPTGLALCQQFGLKDCYITRSGFDNNDKLAITLFRDNSYAQPSATGQFEHYCVAPDQTDTTIHLVNPFGGQDEPAVPLSQFNPAYEGAIMVPISVNQIGVEAVQPGFANGLARLISFATLGRERGKPDADTAATILASDGATLNDMIGTIVNDPGKEFYTRQANLNELIQMLPKLRQLMAAPTGGVSVQDVESDIAKKLTGQ